MKILKVIMQIKTHEKNTATKNIKLEILTKLKNAMLWLRTKQIDVKYEPKLNHQPPTAPVQNEIQLKKK